MIRARIHVARLLAWPVFRKQVRRRVRRVLRGAS